METKEEPKTSPCERGASPDWILDDFDDLGEACDAILDDFVDLGEELSVAASRQ